MYHSDFYFALTIFKIEKPFRFDIGIISIFFDTDPLVQPIPNPLPDHKDLDTSWSETPIILIILSLSLSLSQKTTYLLSTYIAASLIGMTPSVKELYRPRTSLSTVAC